MRKKSLFALLLLIIVGAIPLHAQPQRGGFGGGRGGSDSSFPANGDLLPTVKVFDEDGNQFSTSSLRGQYSVLVFGCLT